MQNTGYLHLQNSSISRLTNLTSSHKICLANRYTKGKKRPNRVSSKHALRAVFRNSNRVVCAFKTLFKSQFLVELFWNDLAHCVMLLEKLIWLNDMHKNQEAHALRSRWENNSNNSSSKTWKWRLLQSYLEQLLCSSYTRNVVWELSHTSWEKGMNYFQGIRRNLAKLWAKLILLLLLA